MPSDVLKNYTSREIAHAMAYYRIKHEQREAEEREREMNEARTRR